MKTRILSLILTLTLLLSAFAGCSSDTETLKDNPDNTPTGISSDVPETEPDYSWFEMPETTDGHQGFYAPMNISGTIEKSAVSLILRDFTMDGMEHRKLVVNTIAQTVALTFGGKAEVIHTQQYLNMKDGLAKSPKVVENLVSAYKAANITPVFPPIRGGTDGSRLTEMGIPTPNIFTGGHSYHSRYEWASYTQMIQATEVLIQLAKVWAA